VQRSFAATQLSRWAAEDCGMRASPRPLVALALAEEVASALATDDTGREEFVQAALAVGQWLADEGRPGRWDTVDAAAVLRALAFSHHAEADGFLLALAGLIGYAGLNGHLRASIARRNLEQIAGLAQDQAVAGFAAAGARQLGGRAR
jgi:hypothetical protein